jgi:hypothetical protein
MELLKFTNNGFTNIAYVTSYNLIGIDHSTLSSSSNISCLSIADTTCLTTTTSSRLIRNIHNDVDTRIAIDNAIREEVYNMVGELSTAGDAHMLSVHILNKIREILSNSRY